MSIFASSPSLETNTADQMPMPASGGMTSLPSQFQPRDARSSQRRKLASRLAKATASVAYEVPANKSARIDTMFFCSVHTGSATLRVHHLRPDESAATSNAIYYDLSLSAKSTTTVTTPIYMSAGDRILILAGTSDHICVTLYGEEA